MIRLFICLMLIMCGAMWALAAQSGSKAFKSAMETQTTYEDEEWLIHVTE